MKKLGVLASAFTAKEAARITGIPYQTIFTWERRGGIAPPPSIRAATGSGKPHRLYSFGDLVELRAIRGLRDMGASAQTLRKVRSTMASLDIDAPLAYIVVSKDGKDLSLTYDENTLMDVLRDPGQISMRVLDIPHVTSEIFEIADEVITERAVAIGE